MNKAIRNAVMYHSAMFVPMAAAKPTIVKLSSYAVQSTRPNMIGMRDNCTNTPFFSLRTMYDITAVNSGAELLIVSTNETATYLNDTRPRRITNDLTEHSKYAPLTHVNITVSVTVQVSADSVPTDNDLIHKYVISSRFAHADNMEY